MTDTKAALFALPLLFACGEPPVEREPADAEETTQQRLVAAERPFFALPDQSEIELRLGHNGVVLDHILRPTDIFASLSGSADGQVFIEDLSIRFGDIVHGIMANEFQGIVLKDARLETTRRHECKTVEWRFDQDQCAAAFDSTLRFFAVIAREGETEMGVEAEINGELHLNVYPGFGRGLRATVHSEAEPELVEATGLEGLAVGAAGVQLELTEAMPL